MTKEEKAVDVLQTTILWLQASAKALEKLGTEEAQKHALEMRGASVITDQWIAEIEEITR